MIIIDLDAEPTDPPASTTLGWTDASTVTVNPRRYRWARARHTARYLRETLTRLGVRAVSAALRLSWRLDVTVGVDAEVVAADADTARTALQRFLRDTARVVAVTPGPGGVGWRELGGVPAEHIGDIVAEPDDVDDPPAVWAVSTVVTASFIVDTRDADLVHGYYFNGYSYGDITPYTEAWPIRRLLAGNGAIRRTPVRRRHFR